jgi:hypothetical protein
MVEIVAATGTTVTVPDEAINVVSGPYHSDSGTKSYVRGNFGPGALESKENASHLVGRLQVTLAMLTRPNGTPVWVKTRAIAILRYPLDTEIRDPPNLVRSVIIVGGFLQALQEDVATVRQIMSKSAPGLLATSSALTGGLGECTNEFFAKVTKVARKGSEKVNRRAPRRRRKG